MNTRLVSRLSLVGATAALAGLSGCAVPYAVDRYPATVEQNPPQTRYEQVPVQRDYRRAPNEALFEARVLSARAVMETQGQRCWTEREQVAPARGTTNVPGALAGAVIGGILGHQIGGGSGQDLATVGGVVAGAAIGSRVGQAPQDGSYTTQDVQRCSEVGNRDQVAYWDVTYEFRGLYHRVQLTYPPGPTVTVNANGEPRE